ASSAAACPSWQRAAATGNGGVVKPLTGSFLRPTSQAVSAPDTGFPEVTFEFNGEGASMFEQITRRDLQKPLGIFLDNQLISAPIIQAVITSTGRITGLASAEAKRLAIQLNAGALPVSIKVVREQDVSSTLGDDSLHKSLVAGAIGVALVAAFVLLYYRFLGLVSIVSFSIYALLVLAIFKMTNVTLTLSGIAAFIISIGFAVDSNIIIFERMREELRSGRSLGGSIETGFDRAWSAIRDSNVAMVIVMCILWWFGDQLGEPRVIGFAIIMLISVLVSMFTAITISRTLLRQLVGTGISKRTELFVDTKSETKPGAPQPQSS
ncbi:MAG: protein translocase subunit SecD, partial [Chloroflexi bacterium]|nr:protein translocase subunit SecD [Chloroflexota bacterium]